MGSPGGELTVDKRSGEGTDPTGRSRRRQVRDRRGRGARGPAIGPPGADAGMPVRVAIRRPTASERFDILVLSSVSQIEARLDSHWLERLGLVEYAVEDAPMVPDDWPGPHVPLSALIRGSGTRPTRLVVFRRPIEHRSATRTELIALIHLVLVEQIAELLGLSPEQIDPRYEPP
jgi:Zincin-like metallopeptidase